MLNAIFGEYTIRETAPRDSITARIAVAVIRVGGHATGVSGAVVIFRLASTCYALPAPPVRECMPLPALFRPPGTPAPVLGHFRLGAERVVVVDLAVLLGLRASPPDDAPPGDTDATLLYRPLLLCDSLPCDPLLCAPLAPHRTDPAARVAFLVDGVQDVRPAAAPATPIPDDMAAEWLTGEIELPGGRSALLMDPARLLLERERQHLAQLATADSVRAALWGDDIWGDDV